MRLLTCDPYRIQTCNLLIRSQILYSVELMGRFASANVRTFFLLAIFPSTFLYHLTQYRQKAHLAHIDLKDIKKSAPRYVPEKSHPMWQAKQHTGLGNHQGTPANPEASKISKNFHATQGHNCHQVNLLFKR